MADDNWTPAFTYHSLNLSSDAIAQIARDQRAEKAELDRRIWGRDFESRGRENRAYRRPPGDSTLDWIEARRLDLQRHQDAERIRVASGKINSQVGLPTTAWTFTLRKLPGKLDAPAKSVLRKAELFLCRFPIAIVEAKGETVRRVQLTLKHSPGKNYKLWPSQSYETTGTAAAKIGGSIKLGLTPNLDIIEIDAASSAEVLWRGEWRWAKATVKASGAGRSVATWELGRDRSAPFAGDSEFHVILQLPKDRTPRSVLATLTAEVAPAGLKGYFFDYTVGEALAVRIPYFVA